MPLEQLPHIDEHRIDAAAAVDDVWEAVLQVFGTSLSSVRARSVARLLACGPSAASDWAAGIVGSSLPGFRITEVDRPRLLVLAGRHRFSRYGVVLRVEPLPAGSRCRLETRAVFPGPRGWLYRAAVLGTGAHVVAVHRLLRAIRRAAEKPGRG